MLDAIYVGESGLKANQLRLNVLSNNIANLNTPAFKKGRVQFADLLYRDLPGANSSQSTGGIGLGTSVSRVDTDLQQGDLRQTDRPLDVTIQGNGFFEVQLGNGQLAYTRLGSLRLGEDGELVTSNGYSFTTAIRIPADSLQITIAANGEVTTTTANDKQPVLLGQIELAQFVNPASLRSFGQGLYQATAEAGAVYYAAPGEDGAGTLKQGFVEASNVDLTEELSELLITQRAYQVNASIVKAGDEILEQVNNLRR